MDSDRLSYLTSAFVIVGGLIAVVGGVVQFARQRAVIRERAAAAASTAQREREASEKIQQADARAAEADAKAKDAQERAKSAAAAAAEARQQATRDIPRAPAPSLEGKTRSALRAWHAQHKQLTIHTNAVGIGTPGLVAAVESIEGVLRAAGIPVRRAAEIGTYSSFAPTPPGPVIASSGELRPAAEDLRRALGEPPYQFRGASKER